MADTKAPFKKTGTKEVAGVTSPGQEKAVPKPKPTEQQPIKGLKKMCNSPAKEGTLCPNCNCLRYSPCGCKKKGA